MGALVSDSDGTSSVVRRKHLPQRTGVLERSPRPPFVREVVDLIERRRAAREHVDDVRRLAEFVVRQCAVRVEPTTQEQVERQHRLAPIHVGCERHWGEVVGGLGARGFEDEFRVSILQCERFGIRRCSRRRWL